MNGSQRCFAVIMAGGSGTRFWPASRAVRPKQFLALGGASESLLQAAVRRLQPLVAPEDVLVVTSERHAEETRTQLPQLPATNVLAEPTGRNTAPCVGWAAAHVRRRDPNAVMAVLPADPHITDEAAYLETLRRAIGAARSGDMVTVGVQPTRPETGYGYVQRGLAVSEGVFRVARFVEKPDRETAEGFLKAGDFFWNSGMFFFKANVLLEEMRRQLPELAGFFERCDDAAARGEEQALVQAEYGTLTSISIDHGVMEKARSILMVPGDFGWYDIGSWTSAWELAARDATGNAVVGEAVVLDSRNCYVRGRADKLIALIGVDDLVVVDTEDALLVMPRERAQDVRDVVAELKARRRERFL
jgi:mannose-1-phosphate guanylyltransferase